MLQAKLRAAGLHALVTFFVALAISCLVFIVWYPDGLAGYVGGTELYVLVLVVEVCLGPLMSVIVYSPEKCLRELRRDYAVILFVQLVALGYGLYATYISRPVYIVHVGDRLHVVSAVDLDSEDLAKAGEFGTLSIDGPRLVCSEQPKDVGQRNALIFAAIAGKDIEFHPQYYRHCRAGEIVQSALSADMLDVVYSGGGESEMPPDGFYTWLPVVGRSGTWVKIFPKGDSENAYYLDIGAW